MACTASKTPFLRAIAIRSYSAQASPKAVAGKVNELQITTLPNHLVVASLDGNLTQSQVSVGFRAGSRYESYAKQGTTHVLRIAAGLSNNNSTGFGVNTMLQATGGNLTVVSDRDSIAYNVEVGRDELPTALKYLQDVSTQPEFRQWEVDEIPYRVKDDLARVPQTARAVDLLHQAAFFQGLGNSVFCAKRNVGKITPEDLQNYMLDNYSGARATVVGVGIDHASLVGYASSLKLSPTGATPAAASKYVGGHLRVDKSGDLATVAVATQGASIANAKEAIAFAILRRVAAAGKGAGSGAPLEKVVAGVLKHPHDFDVLNVAYSDNGLFGFILQANAREVGKGIDAALKALKSGSVSQGDVDRAKAQLKNNVLVELSTQRGRFNNILAGALNGQIYGKDELISAIDAVSVAEVNAAAKKVASGKWSIGAVGNLECVPHVNDLN